MTVGDFLATITNPDKVRIVQQGEDIFVGFLGGAAAQDGNIRHGQRKRGQEISGSSGNPSQTMERIEPYETA